MKTSKKEKDEDLKVEVSTFSTSTNFIVNEISTHKLDHISAYSKALTKATLDYSASKQDLNNCLLLCDIHKDDIILRYYYTYIVLYFDRYKTAPILNAIPNTTIEDYEGMYCCINDHLTDKWINCITKIEYRNSFVSQLLNMKTEGLFRISFPYFLEILRYVYDIIDTISSESILKLFFIDFLKYTFNIINSPKSLIAFNVDMAPIVINKCNKAMIDIVTNFSGHIISIDCEYVYVYNFEEIRTRFIDYTNNINRSYFKYNIVDGYSGLFFRKKKHILIKDNIVYKKGIKIL